MLQVRSDDPFGKGAPESEERQPEGRPSIGGQALHRRAGPPQAGRRYVGEGEKQVPRDDMGKKRIPLQRRAGSPPFANGASGPSKGGQVRDDGGKKQVPRLRPPAAGRLGMTTKREKQVPHAAKLRRVRNDRIAPMRRVRNDWIALMRRVRNDWAVALRPVVMTAEARVLMLRATGP
jgi:hypothetical protein